MKIIGIYLIYSVMSQAYMFKHNVDTARKYMYAYPLWLSDCIAYLNVLQIYFFWTSIRKCVCLDTSLVSTLEHMYHLLRCFFFQFSKLSVWWQWHNLISKKHLFFGTQTTKRQMKLSNLSILLSKIFPCNILQIEFKNA